MIFWWLGFSSISWSRCNAAVASRDTVDWSAGKYGLGEEVKYGFEEKISHQSQREQGNGVTKDCRSAVMRAWKLDRMFFNRFASQVARVLQRQEGVSCATSPMSFVGVVFKGKSCWSTVQQVMIFHTGGDHLRNHQTATQSRLHKVGFQTSLNKFQRLLYQSHVITTMKSITVVIPHPLVCTCFLGF